MYICLYYIKPKSCGIIVGQMDWADIIRDSGEDVNRQYNKASCYEIRVNDM